MKDLETKQEFIELRAAGLSYQKISRQLGVSKQTLINWAKDLNHELANYSAIERDHLLRQFFLVKEARIKNLGSILARLEAEVGKRDFSDVPTEKLMELTLKFSNTLEKEIEPIEFQGEDSLLDIEYNQTLTWTG